MSAERIIDLMVAAIRGETIAGDHVYAARDWSTNVKDLPVILFNGLPEEDYQSMGRGTPQFTVKSTIGLSARLAVEARPDDEAAADVRVALAAFREQIKQAVLNNAVIYRDIQQIERIAVRAKVTIDGSLHIGDLQMVFVVETYLGPEDMHQNPAGLLQGITLATSYDLAQGHNPFKASKPVHFIWEDDDLWRDSNLWAG